MFLGRDADTIVVRVQMKSNKELEQEGICIANALDREPLGLSSYRSFIAGTWLLGVYEREQRIRNLTAWSIQVS